MENTKILNYNPRIENTLKEIGVPPKKIKARTRTLARMTGTTSICLDEGNRKTYNPQAIIFNRVPESKIIKAHNQLYELFCEEV